MCTEPKYKYIQTTTLNATTYSHLHLNRIFYNTTFTLQHTNTYTLTHILQVLHCIYKILSSFLCSLFTTAKEIHFKLRLIYAGVLVVVVLAEIARNGFTIDSIYYYSNILTECRYIFYIHIAHKYILQDKYLENSI